MRAKAIGLIAHPGKAGSPDLVRNVSAEFDRHGVTVFVEQHTATLVGRQSEFSVRDLAEKAELLVVIGGDGTILNVVGQLGEAVLPVFGVNIGGLVPAFYVRG